MKRIIALLAACILLAMLSGCNGGKDNQSYTVMVEKSYAFSVEDGEVRNVDKGGSVSFRLTFDDNFAYAGNNVGADFVNGVLTFSGVRSDVLIVVNTIPIGNGGGTEYKTQTDKGLFYSAAPSDGYVFCGWFLIDNGEKVLYSYGNNITVSNNVDGLKANFIAEEDNVFVVYHANGGKIYDSTDDCVNYCFDSSIYEYPASLGKEFFSVFYRDGFVPTEYNSEPDGSGTAFSLGSRVLMDGQFKHLYVMWERVTDTHSFRYANLYEGGKAVAVAIDKYVGSETAVVIPEYIGELPVVEIREGCFESADISGVVITRNVKSVKKGAFVSCNNLETLYLCDGVEEIYDDSFDNCTNFKNLIMIAVTAPVHCNNAVGSLVRRVEQLYKNRNSEKPFMLFYGGSAMYNGIDGKTIDNYFDGKFNILNLGQNANNSGILMLDIYSSFMRKKDILLFAPEYWIPQYSRELQMIDWIAIEAYYDALRSIDIREYSGVFDSFYEFQNGSQNFSFEAKLKMEAGLYYDFCDEFDKYFTRNFVADKTSMQDMQNGFIDIARLKQEVPSIEKLYSDKIASRDLTMYFSFAPLYARAYNAKQYEFDDFANYLKNNLSCEVLGQPVNFWYTKEMFYDSPVHLTTAGAIHNSFMYCNFLNNVIKARQCS